MPYLEKTYEESKKMFLTLSLLKGTTDIIEGSTVNVSMIVGMEIEIGDIIQPIYDMINMESFACECCPVKIGNNLL